MVNDKLIIISKDKLDNPTIDKAKPILVLPAITKFLESSILHTLEDKIQSDQFWYNQRGFTKGKSTLDNIKDAIGLAASMKNKIK